jgi:hypothetical protein
VCLAVLIAVTACHPRIVRRLTEPSGDARPDPASKYLKVHMRDGRLYILSDWSVDKETITGYGTLFDVNRVRLAEQEHKVPIVDVALLETNVNRRSRGGLLAITIMSATVTLGCALNPKACFGSCPTVYAPDGRGERLQAEAFSASVAPSLEERDVDALFRAVADTDGAVELRVTNEALETHVLRHVRLIAAPRPDGGRVLATGDGELWEALRLDAPLACAAAEGDCLPAVAAFDENERASLADERDLAARETIELSLPRGGRAGIAIGARQTFVTTFLFYQFLAFAGSGAGEYLAALERGDDALRARARGAFDLLGGIEVQVLSADGEWSTVGEFRETGPIATDVQLVLLPERARGAERVRLRLTRGFWRIDWLARVSIGERVAATPLDPMSVRTATGDAPDALDALRDPERSLVTMPGDEYVLRYEPPACPHECELLLDARGYYLEWMRDEWLAEESAVSAALMLAAPRAALRWLAPRYKKMEAEMDALFWSSRYAK